MSTAYPITDRHCLGRVSPKGVLRRRVRTDLPVPEAHHVLVYRIDGQFVRDSDQMRASDQRVLNATHVSVVDTRPNQPVVIEIEVASADASTFKVVVTFACSVIDPVEVVSSGVDCRVALTGYLQAHSRIFDLGLDYRLEQFNELRSAVNAQILSLIHI